MTNQAHNPRFRFARIIREFPDFDVATLPTIPEHWTDSSWHNDAAPFFIISDSLGVFVDYAAADMRELEEGARFMLMPMLERQHVCDGGSIVETDDWNELLSAAIAETFAARLREMLSGDEFAEMRRLNVQHVNDGVCASHDYCDANMPMAAAFEDVTGREPLGKADATVEQNDADCDLWNRAWEIAKARHLTDKPGTEQGN